MADSRLQRVERAAAAGGPLERLRYAKALERLGRRDDALEVLLPVAHDAAVRSEIARFPAWVFRDGDLGHARFNDVPPLRTRPRVLWRTERDRGGRILIASELGVVVEERGGCVAFDAATGAERWREPRIDDSTWQLVGEVVVGSARGDFVGRDLWNGDEVFRARVGEVIGVEAGLALVVDKEGIVARAFQDPRQPPGAVVWSRSWPSSEPPPNGRILLTPTRVIWNEEPEFHVLDLASGEPLWRGAGTAVVADSAGVLATTPPATGASFQGMMSFAQAHGRLLYGNDGSLLWQSNDGFSAPEALAPDAGVAHLVLGYSTKYGIFDRATGRQRVPLDGNKTALAFARDTLYFASSQAEGNGFWAPLRAINSVGEELWRLDPDETAPSFVQVAPLARRLVAIESSGHLVCLGE